MLYNKTMIKLSYKNIKIVYKSNEQRRACVFMKYSLMDHFGIICHLLCKQIKVMTIYLTKVVDKGVTSNCNSESGCQSEILDFIEFFHQNVAGYRLHVCNENVGKYTKVFVIEEIKQGRFYG